MRREVHVRFCERLGVRLPGPTLLIVFHEASLRRTLTSYFDYYHRSRTHLSLGKDSPRPRPVQPLEMGSVVAVPQVGGLHITGTNDEPPETLLFLNMGADDARGCVPPRSRSCVGCFRGRRSNHGAKSRVIRSPRLLYFTVSC
jgi:hypothetical protein